MTEERVKRAIIAAMLTPSVIDGRIRFLKEPAPVVGSSLYLTAKTMISMNPIQKEGMDIPETATVIPV